LEPARGEPDLRLASKQVNSMGDKKPKKNSSGNADAQKAKNASNAANRDAARPKGLDAKPKDKK
jgi:hypothetical protein